MSLDVGTALREGAARTVTRNGLLLVVAFGALGLASTVTTQTLNQAVIEAASRLPGATPTESPLFDATGDQPLAVPMPVAPALALALAVALVAEAARIVAIRVFAGTETRAIPGELVRRNVVLATLNGFLGGVVVLLLVAVGLVALVVPGVFLALSFFFVRQEIAVRDVNFVDAMAGSWRLSKGNRLRLFALVLVVAVLGVVAVVPAVALSVVDPALGAVVGALVGAALTVFSVAVATRAYVQMRDDRESDDAGGTDADDDGTDDGGEDPYDAPLGPDDLPEPE